MYSIQALAPLVACALLWEGSRVAHTLLAGMVAVGVFPYVAASSGEERNGDGGWPAFRHAIPRWGQYWHRSCGRVYEVEGPESWVRVELRWHCWGCGHRSCRCCRQAAAVLIYAAKICRLSSPCSYLLRTRSPPTVKLENSHLAFLPPLSLQSHQWFVDQSAWMRKRASMLYSRPKNEH